MSVEVSVADEENGRQVTLILTPEEYERAQRDTEYVHHLLRNYDSTNGHPNEAIESPPNEAIEPMESPPNGQPEGQMDQESRSLFIWNNQCIFLLLTLYEEYKEEFNRKRHKAVFDVIARKMCEVNNLYVVSGSQCQSKINSLKKHYKKIVDHNATSGNDRATWPYFDRMDELFGSTGWANPVALASEVGPTAPLGEQTETEPKRRKLDYVLEEYRKDMKKYREERAKIKEENLKKILEMKERQHREKMQVLTITIKNYYTVTL